MGARMIEEPVVAKAQVGHPIPAPQPVATPVKKVFMPAPSSSTKKVVPQIAVHRAKVHQLPAFPPLAAAADIVASPMLSSDLHSSMSSFASASSNISDQDDSLADTHGMSSSSFTTSLDTLSDTRSPPSPTPPVLPPPPVSSSWWSPRACEVSLWKPEAPAVVLVPKALSSSSTAPIHPHPSTSRAGLIFALVELGRQR